MSYDTEYAKVAAARAAIEAGVQYPPYPTPVDKRVKSYVYVGGTWKPRPRYCRQARPMPEPFTGQGPPYTPTWVQRWVPLKRVNCRPREVHPIEFFLVAGETLYGDGVDGATAPASGHDDSDVFNSCLSRAVTRANTLLPGGGPRHLVVQLTKTYLCDGILKLEAPPKSTGITFPGSLEITGPGGIVRTRKNADGTDAFIGSDRLDCSLRVERLDHVALTNLSIKSWRAHSATGGRDNRYEAQHGIWVLGSKDVAIRGVTIMHVFGDSIAIGGSVRSAMATRYSDGIRIYRNTFINNGRHICTPLGDNIDYYDNYGSRNASHLFDTETSGGYTHNLLIRNNRYEGANGQFFRSPSFYHRENQCKSHGTNLRGIACLENVRWDSKYGPAADIGYYAAGFDEGWQTMTTRNISGGATTAGSAVVTAPAGTFTVEDANASIAGTNIPAGCTIKQVNSSSSVTIWNNKTVDSAGNWVPTPATGTGTGIVLKLTCRNGVRNHVYECQDLWFLRNMHDKATNGGPYLAFGSDVPNIAGENIQGYMHIKIEDNYGPTRGAILSAATFINTTTETGAPLNGAGFMSLNPGVFRQPGT